MRVLAFDIETVPDLNGLNYRDYRYLKARGRKDKSDEDMEREVSFNPFTLYVVSFSLTAVDNGDIQESVVVYLSDLSNEPESAEVFYKEERSAKVTYIPIRAGFVEGKLYELEEELLKTFWEYIENADSIVSFNGYHFDGYILKVRSMIHGLDIPEKFLRGRNFHLDLLQILSNGEREKKYSLDFVCRKFRIHTPKDIIDGSKVSKEFYRGNYKMIAFYNLKDSLAIAQLYQKLRKYLEEEREISEEPPTEGQLRYLTNLISQTTGINSETVREILTDFAEVEEGGLTKRSISVMIDIVKRLKDHPL